MNLSTPCGNPIALWKSAIILKMKENKGLLLIRLMWEFCMLMNILHTEIKTLLKVSEFAL